MKHLLRAAILVFAGLNAVPAYAGPEPFVGEVETFAFKFCPGGWLPMNGQLISITNYIVLFNLIGATYGGDGTTTFALPLSKPVLTLQPGTQLIQCIAYLGVFPSRN